MVVVQSWRVQSAGPEFWLRQNNSPATIALNCKKWIHGLRRIANSRKGSILVLFGVSFFVPLAYVPIWRVLGSAEGRFWTLQRSWIPPKILIQSENSWAGTSLWFLYTLVLYSLAQLCSDCMGISVEVEDYVWIRPIVLWFLGGWGLHADLQDCVERGESGRWRETCRWAREYRTRV